MLRPVINPYGVSKAIIGLSQELRSQGHRPFIVASNAEDDPILLSLHRAGLQYRRVPIAGRNPVSLLRSRKALRSIVEQEDITVIHCHHRWSTLVATPVARKVKVPLLVTCHGLHSGRRLLSVWGDGVICVSEDASRHLRQYFGVPAEKVTVIPNGIDLNAYIKPPTSYVDPPLLTAMDADIVYLHIARLSPEKDQVTLVRAMKRVLQECPGALLLIAGTGPSDRIVKREVERHGIDHAVRFLGHVNDVRGLLFSADVFVLSSRTEGLPMSVLEAFAAGLPVVSTAVGDVPRLVINGVTGILMPPGNPEALANALIHLYHNGQERSRMGAEGNRLISREFSLADVARRTLEVYNSVSTSRVQI